MSGARRAVPRGPRSVLLTCALVGGVLVLVLFGRPDDETSSNDAPAPSPSTSTSASASAPEPTVASEEAFCAEFRRLAAMQSEYVAAPDQRATELLREAADRLLDVGVPRTMTLPARSGYYTVLEGVYQSIGLSLDPAAVGALDEPPAGSDAAFSSYLSQYCPA